MLRGSTKIADIADDYRFEEEAVFEREGYPRMVFVEKNYSADPTNWRIPNRAGMEAMLRSSGFAIVGATDYEVYLCRRGERGFMVDPPPAIAYR